MKRMLKYLRYTVLFILITSAVIGLYYANNYNLLPSASYYASDFKIDIIISTIDFNKNEIDDYTDFVIGARLDAKNHPKYDGSYYNGGFPPDNIGVCTDVVWRAFKEAGYNLRMMVDKDVHIALDEYFNIDIPDNNIDFRRVKNLKVFFERNALVLTNDINDINAWQPGDIVIFGDNTHIGIVSDKRNKNGQPYIIHNGGQLKREENYFKRDKNVTGHYRFDASLVNTELLISW